MTAASSEDTLPSYEAVSSVLTYSPDTGYFHWCAPRKGRSIGSRAGCSTTNGRRVLKVFDRQVQEHRLAWLLHTGSWPPAHLEIDHINGDQSDNRIANLRLATGAQNARNSRMKGNLSGLKGINERRPGKWIARIKVNYKEKHLGTFATKEMAYAAYCEAARHYHGEFAKVI